jgi:hypothetical protein
MYVSFWNRFGCRRACAGTAAALAVQKKTSVQNVDLSLLQKTFMEQRQVINFIPGQPEKFPGRASPLEF